MNEEWKRRCVAQDRRIRKALTLLRDAMHGWPWWVNDVLEPVEATLENALQPVWSENFPHLEQANE